MPKIRVGAVSYLNTKPLLYGLQQPSMLNQIDLSLDYPSQLARKLKTGEIDLALLPIAAMPGIPNSFIASPYGIGATGRVASVCIFSQVPMPRNNASLSGLPKPHLREAGRSVTKTLLEARTEATAPHLPTTQT